jgi:lipopolysaccharide export system protein LptA
MAEPYPTRRRILGTIPALPGLLLATALGAQPLDPQQLPVHILADRAELDDRSGVGVYSGSVRVTRGDMVLQADRIEIHTTERRPFRIDAEGQPVRVDGLDDDRRPWTATALRMEYHFEGPALRLFQDARIQTPTEEARGERISYDLGQEVLRVEGDTGRRVEITIQPRPE